MVLGQRGNLVVPREQGIIRFIHREKRGKLIMFKVYRKHAYSREGLKMPCVVSISL